LRKEIFDNFLSNSVPDTAEVIVEGERIMNVTNETFDRWVDQRRETHSIENLNIIQAEDCILCRKQNEPS